LTLVRGTPEPSWLWRACDVPVFVSRNRLVRLAAPPRANAMGAGGFTEVTGYGRWRLPAQAYVRDVARFDREIGCLEWAAPQDWMCEPKAFVATGMTIAEHQARTVESVVELREWWPRHSDDTCPIMPVLQGLGSRRLHHVPRAVPPVGDQRTLSGEPRSARAGRRSAAITLRPRRRTDE